MTGWGWFYLSTVLADLYRYIVAWKLCTTMKAEDVTDTLELALQESGLDQVNVAIGLVCIDTGELRLGGVGGMARQTRHAAYPRRALSSDDTGEDRALASALKNRILLENYYLLGQLEARIEASVAHYNLRAPREHRQSDAGRRLLRTRSNHSAGKRKDQKRAVRARMPLHRIFRSFRIDSSSS